MKSLLEEVPSPEFLFKRGDILSRIGKHDEAIESLSEMLKEKLPPNLKAQALEKRSEFYRAAGKEAEAKADEAEAKKLLKDANPGEPVEGVPVDNPVDETK